MGEAAVAAAARALCESGGAAVATLGRQFAEAAWALMQTLRALPGAGEGLRDLTARLDFNGYYDGRQRSVERDIDAAAAAASGGTSSGAAAAAASSLRRAV